VAAFEDGKMIGVSIDQPFEQTLPGGRMAPIRGITWVGVLPDFRGRGALRAMIEFQHRSFHEQGLVLAALFASETTIYGRFGYGPATVVASEAEIDTRRRLRAAVQRSGSGGDDRRPGADRAGARGARPRPPAHPR
jgi:predicted acetyltransferase